MEILDNQIEHEGNDLGGRDRTNLLSIASLMMIKGIFFFMLAFGNLCITALILLKSKERYNFQSNISYFDRVEWEPVILFGISGILAAICGFYGIFANNDLRKCIRTHNKIEDYAIKKWHNYHQVVAILIGFVAIDVTYLIVKHAL